MIDTDDLAFLDEAKQAFEANPVWETYIDEKEKFIALRQGLDRDCIEIYRLGDRVANFIYQLEPTPLERKLNKKQEEK